MKKIFAYFGYVLSVALVGALTACNPQEVADEDAAALSIKTFFPAKVVANQPMTVNGNGMDAVREVVFPGGVTVTSLEHVGNGMIRLTAPSGIASGGGPLTVRSADDEAVSRFDLTVGNPVVDQLEAAGIVGPFEGSKARKVLFMDEGQLEQYLQSL